MTLRPFSAYEMAVLEKRSRLCEAWSLGHFAFASRRFMLLGWGLETISAVRMAQKVDFYLRTLAFSV